MTHISDFDAPKKPWLRLMVPILIVLGFAVLFLFLLFQCSASVWGRSPLIEIKSLGGLCKKFGCLEVEDPVDALGSLLIDPGSILVRVISHNGIV